MSIPDPDLASTKITFGGRRGIELREVQWSARGGYPAHPKRVFPKGRRAATQNFVEFCNNGRRVH